MREGFIPSSAPTANNKKDWFWKLTKNIKRFPNDFMFRLTKNEFAEVVTNCDHLQNIKFRSTQYALLIFKILNQIQVVWERKT